MSRIAKDWKRMAWVFCMVGMVTLGHRLAFAEGGDEGGGFAEHKKHMLQELDQRISAIQTAKTCVTAATDHESMKRCRMELEKFHRKMREENLDARIKQLQEEKARLDKKS